MDYFKSLVGQTVCTKFMQPLASAMLEVQEIVLSSPSDSIEWTDSMEWVNQWLHVETSYLKTRVESVEFSLRQWWMQYVSAWLAVALQRKKEYPVVLMPTSQWHQRQYVKSGRLPVRRTHGNTAVQQEKIKEIYKSLEWSKYTFAANLGSMEKWALTYIYPRRSEVFCIFDWVLHHQDADALWYLAEAGDQWLFESAAEKGAPLGTWISSCFESGCPQGLFVLSTLQTKEVWVNQGVMPGQELPLAWAIKRQDVRAMQWLLGQGAKWDVLSAHPIDLFLSHILHGHLDKGAQVGELGHGNRERFLAFLELLESNWVSVLQWMEQTHWPQHSQPILMPWYNAVVHHCAKNS